MSTLDLILGAEPFYFAGNDTGCLVLHGFTASPNEVRELGSHLAAQGYTVLGPRLTHHGSNVDDMRRSRFYDWYLAALDGWHLLNAHCRRIVVVGMSMGGSTALLLAARQPVAALISMSAPVSMPNDLRLRILPLYARLRPFLPKPWWDESQRASRYHLTPTIALHELRQYVQVVHAALPQITAPALLMHSRSDTTVPPANVEQIYAAIGSQQKELIWWDDADHVLTEDPRHQQSVFEHAVRFITQVVPA